MLQVFKAEREDLDRIMEIYALAREYMIRTGNPDQWGRDYPPRELIEEDIARGACRVIKEDGVIHGVFAVFGGEEPTYARIDGKGWLNGRPYVTIHRMAGDGQVRGLFGCAVDHCKCLSGEVRIDTHERNSTMRHLIEKNGFVPCGIIYVRDGSARLAYQWSGTDSSADGGSVL